MYVVLEAVILALPILWKTWSHVFIWLEDTISDVRTKKKGQYLLYCQCKVPLGTLLPLASLIRR